MVSYLQKIIGEAPAYVSQFVSCLMHPKTKLSAT